MGAYGGRGRGVQGVENADRVGLVGHLGRAVEVCDTIMAADACVLNYRLPAQ
ncbi:hypothetical protein GCM10009654_48740 [Streptomyces hebeiensis]|uniref:Uncharacterized protein n=1 Tax=Streptomyces hebeiensis TaxID=229486 RepID=A0ABN1V0H4_9ACTN